jgi:hypothetical protein
MPQFGDRRNEFVWRGKHLQRNVIRDRRKVLRDPRCDGVRGAVSDEGVD